VFELSLESNESVGVVCFDVEFECFEFGCCDLAECASDCTAVEELEEVSDSARARHAGVCVRYLRGFIGSRRI
jgi:hypothetical protein